MKLSRREGFSAKTHEPKVWEGLAAAPPVSQTSPGSTVPRRIFGGGKSGLGRREQPGKQAAEK